MVFTHRATALLVFVVLPASLLLGGGSAQAQCASGGQGPRPQRTFLPGGTQPPANSMLRTYRPLVNNSLMVAQQQQLLTILQQQQIGLALQQQNALLAAALQQQQGALLISALQQQQNALLAIALQQNNLLRPAQGPLP